MSTSIRKRLRCFVALPYAADSLPVREAVEKGVKLARFGLISLEKSPTRPETVQEVMIGELARADCVIADISTLNPNVFFELGLGKAMGKALFLLVDGDRLVNVPIDLQGYQHIEYARTRTGLSKLSENISAALKEYRRAPRLARPFSAPRFVAPFVIDWDRLNHSDVENLIRELLLQMGFRQIDWGSGRGDIDLVAELPKKDPDGFEYREVWFVAMGQRGSQHYLFDMAVSEPEYFLHRFSNEYGQRFERLSSQIGSDAPLTLLVILNSADPQLRDFDRLRIRNRKSQQNNLRIRVWDRAYLSALVQQFPLIGYKYFSDEARSGSETRKTYEELYQEMAELNERYAATIVALEDEKNRRIRAERDAVWKDISFSAAHKIGNPIFAIETNLDPLAKRLRENRLSEATEIVESIRTSVDKANGIVEQFKSLTRAQEISPREILLRPILESTSNMLILQGVECTIVCPAELYVLADPDRIAECFDELARNTLHWFEKPERRVNIEVSEASATSLPTEVDSTRQYALIHFRDNGAGIPVQDKAKIFDAFYTKREHGTGLGLALARRIIEGHGGAIVECGMPGQGADFEIHLPRVENSPVVTGSRTSRKRSKQLTTKE